jgi:hypothetical protein
MLSPNLFSITSCQLKYRLLVSMLLFIHYYYCPSGVLRMSGGNMERSRSLLDVAGCPTRPSSTSTGSSSEAGPSTGGSVKWADARQCQHHMTLSRSLADLSTGTVEEGLALLGDRTTVNDVPEQHGGTPEIDNSILDYNSGDSEYKQEQETNVGRQELPVSTCVGDTHIGAVSSGETDLHIKSSTGPPTSRDPHPSSLPLEAYSNTTSSILRTV